MDSEKGKAISVEERCAIELALLERFDGFAQEHGLTYWLFWGTLLGAVRHKGLIPWDDDIDIAMPQQDYLRLIELMRDGPLEDERIRLNAFELDDRYTRPFAKLCDTRTVLFEDFDISYVEEGICIDIFPLLPAPENNGARATMRKRWRKDFVMSGLSKGRLVPHKSIVKTMSKAVLRPFAKIRSYKPYILDLCGDIASVSTSFGACSHVLCVEESVKEFDATWFSQTAILPFEHMMLPAPACWDEVLTTLYGDYMVPPPEDKRLRHQSEAYWKPGFEI